MCQCVLDLCLLSHLSDLQLQVYGWAWALKGEIIIYKWSRCVSVFVFMEGRWAKNTQKHMKYFTLRMETENEKQRWTSASFVHCSISFYISCTMQARFYMRALWVEIAITHTCKTIFADPENKHKIHASTLVIIHDLAIQPHNLQSWHSAFMPLTCTSWHLIYDLSLHIYFAIFHPLPTTFICSSRIKLPITTDLDS